MNTLRSRRNKETKKMEYVVDERIQLFQDELEGDLDTIINTLRRRAVGLEEATLEIFVSSHGGYGVGELEITMRGIRKATAKEIADRKAENQERSKRQQERELEQDKAALDRLSKRRPNWLTDDKRELSV